MPIRLLAVLPALVILGCSNAQTKGPHTAPGVIDQDPATYELPPDVDGDESHAPTDPGMDGDTGASIDTSDPFDSEDTGADEEPLPPPGDCSDIASREPTSPDGLYDIQPSEGAELISVFCMFDHPDLGALTYPAFAMDRDLRAISWWNMEAHSGAGRLLDLSGSNDLQPTSGPTAVPGIRGGAQHFGDTTSGAFFQSQSDFDADLAGAAPKSLFAWVKLGSTSGDGDESTPLVSFGSGEDTTSGAHCGPAQSFGLSAYQGHPMFVSCGADAFARMSLNPNSWTSLAITYDGSSVRMYVDAQPVSLYPWTAEGLEGTTYADRYDLELDVYASTDLGGYVVGADSWWWTRAHKMGDGAIDEVRVYKHTLTQAQVAALHELDLALH